MRQHTRSLPSGLLATLLLLAPAPVSSFYIPGIAPTSYKHGDTVPLHVNHLTPATNEDVTQMRSVFAFNYYQAQFHFCQPREGPQQVSESLGSILFGDRIETSPFELKMGINETCKAACEAQTFDVRDAKFVNRRIWQNYNINLLVDGLPAGTEMMEVQTRDRFYSPGFPLGRVEDEKPYLNTHYDIVIDYHEPYAGQFRVVGASVNPSSVQGSKSLGGQQAECETGGPVVLSEKEPTTVVYTYSVYWRESPTIFATRWDKYLHVYDPKIHWFSLVNSAVIVIFLVGMVFTILVRTLRKDIQRYNRLDQLNLDDLSGTGVVDEGVQEDSGWKLVHGDVFRPPKNPLLLSVLLGNGAQLFMMSGFTIGITPPHPAWEYILT